MNSSIGERDLLTTGQVARRLGVTVQHVRNLCDSGLIPCVYVGSHRRIRLADFEDLERQQQGGLLRDQARSLWLHQAVAGKLVLNPTRVLGVARGNLAKLQSVHQTGAVTKQFEAWKRILSGPLTDVLNVLTSTAPHAIELRQNSPFAGVLTDHEREQVLKAFRANYKLVS